MDVRPDGRHSPLGHPSAKRFRSNSVPVFDTPSRASPTFLISPFSREWGLLEDDYFTKDLLARAQNFQFFLPDNIILSLMTLGAHYREDAILTEEEEAESSPIAHPNKRYCSSTT
ncbi:hypothetical protein OAN21_02015 [Alphaproteobacteria bacterium]|nr:hypothetical protein [Alphaproteobacteria bacterium]